jgi:hypothetical protein
MAPLSDRYVELAAADSETWLRSTPGNQGNAFRKDDVDIESCSEGGYNVAWMTNGEWLEFDFAAARADTFNIAVRVACPLAKAQGFQLLLDDVDLADWVAVPSTVARACREILGRPKGRPAERGSRVRVRGRERFRVRSAGRRRAIRVPFTLTQIAHASRTTLVATAHATAHGHAGRRARGTVDPAPGHWPRTPRAR